MTKNRVGKFSTGTMELDVDEFDLAHTRVRISIMMEGDLLSKIKEEAKSSGVPYQTLMKSVLRRYFLGDETSYARHSEQLGWKGKELSVLSAVGFGSEGDATNRIDQLEKRLSKLEGRVSPHPSRRSRLQLKR